MWLQKYVNYRSMWNYTECTFFSPDRQCFGGLGVSTTVTKCTFIFHSCRQGVISTFLICQIRNEKENEMLSIMKCMHMCMTWDGKDGRNFSLFGTILKLAKWNE
jgi:hypothetical protein